MESIVRRIRILDRKFAVLKSNSHRSNIAFRLTIRAERSFGNGERIEFKTTSKSH